MNRTLLILLLLPLLGLAQFQADKSVTIAEEMQDDVYLAGESISINAIVDGDVVVAGSEIVVRDSIQQDLIVAGGEILVNGYVKDDIRAGAGQIILDNTVGDDVVVFGGEVFITEDAIIHGNLIIFSGEVELYGDVRGEVKASGGFLNLRGKVAENVSLQGGRIWIDGEVSGTSTLVAEEITIGDNARFYGDVAYWSEDGEVDFGDSLVNVRAIYDEALKEDVEGVSWEGLGLATLWFWIFYVISAFLILLLLNWAFGNVFRKATDQPEDFFWKGFGYGLIYLIGVPILVVSCFVILVGIPIGLFILAFYVFSIFFGHLVAAVMTAHYVNRKRNGALSFWGIVFLSLGIAVVLRLFTVIPILGWLISLVVLAITYGVLLVTFLSDRKSTKVVVS